MSTSWTLREACTGHARAIAEHRYYTGQSQVDIDAYATWLETRIERGSYIGFVAESAGRVIAGAGAVLLDWGPTRGEPSSTRARIANVYTDKAWRGQGIAKALVSKVLTACDGLGVRTFNLATSPTANRCTGHSGSCPMSAR
jgi:GNAT superfamily N-acetyltransferase